MHESSRLHRALKQVLAASASRAEAKRDVCPLGLAGIDRVLGGGLARGKLHEVFAQDTQGDASATGFAAMLALCFAGRDDASSPILWLREEKAQRRAGLYGPGLADLGLDPARLILGILPDAKALLRAGVDALRCGALGAVVLELGGNPPLLNLTSSRRLALAAEASGVTPLLLRLSDARPAASAAQTRWQVASAPSVPLAGAAPGHPALTISLLRQRGGPAGFDWNVEWDRDAVSFRATALPGARLPLSGGGPVPAGGAAGEAGEDRWRIAV